MAGTYKFDSAMEGCDAALCIDRAVTIEAQATGSVVLNAEVLRRVIRVSSDVQLIGLNITGGYASVVCFHDLEPRRRCEVHHELNELHNAPPLKVPSLLHGLNLHPAPLWYAHCWRCVVAGLREFCAESNPRM